VVRARGQTMCCWLWTPVVRARGQTMLLLVMDTSGQSTRPGAAISAAARIASMPWWHALSKKKAKSLLGEEAKSLLGEEAKSLLGEEDRHSTSTHQQFEPTRMCMCALEFTRVYLHTFAWVHGCVRAHVLANPC